jgi:exodeoxyribonuclease VIII
MRQNTSIMVDIETMGTTPDCAIVSIGACAFDHEVVNSFDEISDRFYTTVSIQSNEEAGRRIQASTVEWWLKQKPEAQKALFEEPVRSLRAALIEFRMWAQSMKPAATFIWANDPDFDVVILKSAFENVGQMWPFQYYNNRSVRTIKHLAWPNDDAPDFRSGTVHHKADDDAVVQAVMVQHAYNKIVLGGK